MSWPRVLQSVGYWPPLSVLVDIQGQDDHKGQFIYETIMSCLDHRLAFPLKT